MEPKNLTLESENVTTVTAVPDPMGPAPPPSQRKVPGNEVDDLPVPHLAPVDCVFFIYNSFDLRHCNSFMSICTSFVRRLRGIVSFCLVNFKAWCSTL